MALILGVFDLLAYAIPGSLYLAVFAYASHRAGWIDAPGLLEIPTLLLIIAAAVAAFLLGQAAYPLGSLLDRINPFGSIDLQEVAKADFLRRNAAAAQRRFLQADPFTLLAALEADDDEAAAEVSRLRATGLMLGGCVPPLVLGVMTALVETFTGSLPLFAGLTALVLALVAVGCLRQSAAFHKWAIVRTYELSYWNGGLDARLADEQQ
jgi:hypothetical protein